MPSDRPSTIDRTNSGLSSPAMTAHRTMICEIYSLSHSNENVEKLEVLTQKLAITTY